MLFLEGSGRSLLSPGLEGEDWAAGDVVTGDAVGVSGLRVSIRPLAERLAVILPLFLEAGAGGGVEDMSMAMEEANGTLLSDLDLRRPSTLPGTTPTLCLAGVTAMMGVRPG